VSPTMACHFRQLKQYDLGKWNKFTIVYIVRLLI
jgi:hypothetical protein